MKKMTNPLAIQFQNPIVIAPTFYDMYEQLDFPFVLDIGCGKGKYLSNVGFFHGLA